MTANSGLLEEITAAVAGRKREQVARLTGEAAVEGLPASDLREALLSGMDDVRRRLMSNSASIPEFLLCLDAATDGLAVLAEAPGHDLPTGLPLVIGVVRGDPHDMGKSIVAGVYKAYGYNVIDLGCQVPADEFVQAVLENDAGILALSAMMSTTMGEMLDIVREVKERSPATAVMVGGAPMDRALAVEYGADGYAESAVSVLEETEGAVERVSEGRKWR
jgi:methanogenic corrinoid protein MtbC1